MIVQVFFVVWFVTVIIGVAGDVWSPAVFTNMAVVPVLYIVGQENCMTFALVAWPIAVGGFVKMAQCWVHNRKVRQRHQGSEPYTSAWA